MLIDAEPPTNDELQAWRDFMAGKGVDVKELSNDPNDYILTPRDTSMWEEYSKLWAKFWGCD
jgi:hypothetical protein